MNILGSCDGFIRLWKCKSGRHLVEINRISVEGFINALNFTSDGKSLIAAVGREYRLGRWFCQNNVKNSIIIIPLIT